MNKQLREENKRLREKLGMPELDDYQDQADILSCVMSDNEDDSGGADSKQDSQDQSAEKSNQAKSSNDDVVNRL